MKVFKFGGASVKDAGAVKNVGSVIQRYADQELLIVVSAMGKTTNALEQLARAYYNRDTNRLAETYTQIKTFHDEVIQGLLKNDGSHAYDDIQNLFIELECLLETEPEENFDETYDQIVSYGEMFSTRIVSTYLNESGIKNRWLDARNFINTDNTPRDARVDWQLTTQVIERKLKPILSKQLVVTQGFIGQNKEHQTTTLGREGSDYSAAIFAYGLNADSVTIWKDVAGVMNADPKKIADAQKLDEISYTMAIEMAYYGATVIHPKTIQPLQSKNIPLYVKSFLNPDAQGTVVSNKSQNHKLPVIISKSNQVLISILSKDFSFIVEDNLSKIFSHFAGHGIKLNLMQNSAISFTVCVDNTGEKLERLKNDLSIYYNLHITDEVEIYTIMYFDEPVIAQLTASREVLMEQRNRNTAQFVVK
jgi:aspartate kinase